MLKVVIALVLLAHGIRHSMGMLQVLKVATVNPSGTAIPGFSAASPVRR